MSARAIDLFLQLREDLGSDRVSELRDEVRAHYASLLEAQKKSELIAVDLAKSLCDRLEQLLAVADLMAAEPRAHIVGAARYFVSSADERPDDQSCTGLDDDVEVFNHAMRLIGRTDLLIED